MSLVPDLSSVGMVVHPSPPPSTRTPTKKKTREGLEKRKRARKREVRLSRLRQHTMTPIYTRSASASICIFKKILCHLSLSAQCACLHGKVAHMWKQCVRGNNNSSFVCHSVCVTCFNTHCEVGLVWPCVAT